MDVREGRITKGVRKEKEEVKKTGEGSNRKGGKWREKGKIGREERGCEVVEEREKVVRKEKM